MPTIFLSAQLGQLYFIRMCNGIYSESNWLQKRIYVCSRASRKDNLHTWTEINGRVYDSYFGKRRGMNSHCGIKYSQYDYKVNFRKKSYKHKNKSYGAQAFILSILWKIENDHSVRNPDHSGSSHSNCQQLLISRQTYLFRWP